MKRTSLLHALVAASFSIGAVTAHAQTAGSLSDPSGPVVLDSQRPDTAAAERGNASASSVNNGGDPSGPVAAAHDSSATETGMRMAPGDIAGHSAGSISEPSGPNPS